MTWQSYIIPVVASSILMVACWSVGHYSFSFVWICFFIVLYVFKTHVWMRREQRRLRLRSVILAEREVIMAQFGRLDDLPAWVQFPDIERIEWVNKIISQLWPYIGEYTKQFLREFIEPQVKSQMPSPFKSFKFTSIDCGDIPCRVGGLKVYTNNVGRDKIIVDLDVVYAGDAEFTVQTCGFKGGLNQLVLTGKVRCVLEPLLSHPPMFGAMAASFTELPNFDFNLTGMGEFVQLPGLIDAIKSIINSQVANLAVLPNKIVLPLVADLDVTKLYFPEPDGVIRLKIIEAYNLENKDISILKKDKSDPYCEVQVGSQIYRTRTINNNLNPVFNECFEAVVDEASAQKLRIELFDEDSAGSDEELGRLTVPLDAVRKAGALEKLFHLEGCKHGDLRLRISWFNLSSDFLQMEKVEWENEWITSDRPVHPALLMVFIDSVKDLPFPKINLEPSPFIEVTLAGITQRTPVRPKCIHPVYLTKFLFFVKEPGGKELKLKAVDDGTRRELGEVSIPLSVVMNQPRMELFQQTFHLALGVHTCPIVMTIRLRAPVPQEEPPPLSPKPTPSVYGNASYIERAENSTNSYGDGMIRNGDAVACPEPGKANEDIGIAEIAGVSTPSAEQLLRSRASSSMTGSSSVNSPQSHNFIHRLKTAKNAMKGKASLGTPAGSLGSVQLALRYNEEEFKLIVDVGEARGLKAVSASGYADPYAKVKLKPCNANGTKVLGGAKGKGSRKTATVYHALNPNFGEQFDFNIHFSELQSYRLVVVVKDATNYGVLTKPPSLGRVELMLRNFDPKRGLASQWFNLQPDSDQ